ERPRLLPQLPVVEYSRGVDHSRSGGRTMRVLLDQAERGEATVEIAARSPSERDEAALLARTALFRLNRACGRETNETGQQVPHVARAISSAIKDEAAFETAGPFETDQ